MVDEDLNAPFGARCFLTKVMSEITKQREMGGLNAPFGARCFLTMSNRSVCEYIPRIVLMHLLALGAF